MKSVEFCYWLQGYFEIVADRKPPNNGQLSAAQVRNIQKHLAMVFKHEIDPSYPKEQQAALDDLHGSAGGDFLIRC